MASKSCYKSNENYNLTVSVGNFSFDRDDLGTGVSDHRSGKSWGNASNKSTEHPKIGKIYIFELLQGFSLRIESERRSIQSAKHA